MLSGNISEAIKKKEILKKENPNFATLIDINYFFRNYRHTIFNNDKLDRETSLAYLYKTIMTDDHFVNDNFEFFAQKLIENDLILYSCVKEDYDLKRFLMVMYFLEEFRIPLACSFKDISLIKAELHMQILQIFLTLKLYFNKGIILQILCEYFITLKFQYNIINSKFIKSRIEPSNEIIQIVKRNSSDEYINNVFRWIEQKHLKELDTNNNPIDISDVYLFIGSTASLFGCYQEASKYYEKGYKKITVDNKPIANVFDNRSDLFKVQIVDSLYKMGVKDYERMISLLMEVTNKTTNHSNKQMKSNSSWLLYNIFKELDADIALYYANESIEIIEENISQICDIMDIIDYHNNFKSKYEDVAQFAFNQGEQYMALFFIDKLKSRALSQYLALLNPSHNTILEEIEFDMDKLVNRNIGRLADLFNKADEKGDKIIVVNYFVLPNTDQIFVQLIGDHNNDGIFIKPFKFEYNDKIKKFVKSFETSNWFFHEPSGNLHVHSPFPENDFQMILKEVYDVLFKDIDNFVVEYKATKLFIIPHQELHAFPFNALYCDDDYIINSRDYIISVMPSLSCLFELLQHTARSVECVKAIDIIEDKNNEAIGEVGISDNLIGRFPDVNIFRKEPLNDNMFQIISNEEKVSSNTFSDLFEKNKNTDLFISSGHGNYNALPYFSYIMSIDYITESSQNFDTKLSLYSKNGPSIMTLREYLGAGFNTVLLNCFGASSEMFGSDERIGFIEGFFMGGTRNITASLWEVFSGFLHDVLPSYFNDISSGIPFDEALHKMQRRVLNDKDFIEYRHPSYWAGFQFYGWPY
ncbi:MAG: CHAT domain-containing protein [Candidatus Latescibacteria bacterium]|nr:CHAT domain-containing protein [Candidatus Latescibacterota bacterium]